ncbi:MAG TPA: hypothetical protein VM695_02745 [Phycisphaerae bacterium]|nr:hypothetical protein [Phycisphaerae bacterium]
MVCRIHRWGLSRRLASGAPLGEALRRHLAGCDRCRAYHEQWQAMAKRLREETPPAGPLAPQLSARILAAVRSAQAPAARPAPRGRTIRLLAPLAAAATILLAVGGYFLLPPDKPPVDPNHGTAVVRSVPLPPGPDELTQRFWTDVERLAGAPMADEVRRLARDTEDLGNSLLARLPLDLLRAGDGRWLDDLLPGSAGPAGPPPTSGPSPKAGRQG